MVDAVVGGGGLIRFPCCSASSRRLPSRPCSAPTKVSSIAGTGAALWRYARSVRIPWLVVLPGTAAAWSAPGPGGVVAWLPRETMRPLVVVLMIAVASTPSCARISASR